MSRRATLLLLCAAVLMLAGAPGLARVGVVVGIAPPAPPGPGYVWQPGSPLAALAAVRLDGATPRTRQARKNPPEPYRDMIRAWGAPYSPPARPDELVQGAGAPRDRSGVALAGALGMPAEDIRVRDCAGLRSGSR
jgi:hypothetical protein